jgi:AraC-like DNA-binding protein
LDPLTQTIALLRPRGLLWKQAEARGDWAVRYPANKGAVFCLIASGSCVFQLPGREPSKLQEGDFLLLTAPPAWTLGSSAAVAPVDFVKAHTRGGVVRRTLGNRKTGPVVRLFGGHFGFDDANAPLLAGLLPAIVEIRSSDADAARLRGVLDLIGSEASSDRPGRGLVLDRLLEILLIEAVRSGAMPDAQKDRRGLLAGLAEPRISAALRALHADIRQGWTVARLAEVAGMSRSVFAERFCRVVGLPPLDYLRRWRMAVAKDALVSGNRRLAEVAFACGYESVSAFSTAFTRTVGCPPSRYERFVHGRRGFPNPAPQPAPTSPPYRLALVKPQ